MLCNLLRKQKWSIVDFFREAGVGTRKIPGAGFIQVIKGVCREQNRSELLALPYVLVCRPRVVSVEEVVAVQQGALCLTLRGRLPQSGKLDGKGRGKMREVGCHLEWVLGVRVPLASWSPKRVAAQYCGCPHPAADSELASRFLVSILDLSPTSLVYIFPLRCLSAHICAALLTLSLSSQRVQQYRAVRSTLRSTTVWQCRCLLIL